MLQDTHKAFRALFEDPPIYDLDEGLTGRKKTQVQWADSSEWAGVPPDKRKPVTDLTTTTITIRVVSISIDSNRARNAHMIKRVLVNKNKVLRKQEYWEPRRIMYQVDVRTDGPQAASKLWFTIGEIIDRAPSPSYMPVTTDIWGDGEKYTIPCLVVRQEETVTPPTETGRREFIYHFTFLVDSGKFVGKKRITQLPVATSTEVDVTVESPIGDTTEKSTAE